MISGAVSGLFAYFPGYTKGSGSASRAQYTKVLN